MLKKKLKWYLLFDDRKDFERLFEWQQSVVHRSMFGEVLLIKDEEQFHAFKNKCPHQNKPLNGCEVSDGHVVCPFHRYHFSCETGRGHGLYIEKYQLRFEKNQVFLGKEVWSLF